VAGCCECGDDEPWGSCAMELVSRSRMLFIVVLSLWGGCMRQAFHRDSF
jgi:hypothetical protein